MKLPDGIQQDTACMFIAYREFFDDPNWEDEEMIENIRNNKDKNGAGGSLGWRGSFIDFQRMANRLGLWCDCVTIPGGQSGNADYLVGYNAGKRYRWPRNAKFIVGYFTERRNLHMVTIKAYQFNIYADKLWAFATERHNMIIDKDTR